MNWTELLKSSIEATYAPTEGMIKMVEPGELSWKPETGANWMTTGQLLMHITTACGHCFRGFVTGDWGMPEGGDMTEDELLPPAEKLPTVGSPAEAKALLAQDKQLALEMLAQCSEEQLTTKLVTAPWNLAT